MSKYRFVQLDVFTNEPFAGNALAVFPEAERITDKQMMKIARAMNLSETVSVLTPDGSATTGGLCVPSTMSLAGKSISRRRRQ